MQAVVMILLMAIVPITSTTPPPADAPNIALSATILHRVGDLLWPDWSKAPFAIDLITANGPVEVNFERPVPAPSFPPELEATFPWPNGVPTIVIGEPQFTQAKTPIRWSVTLIHEHFHQWQDAWPGYYPAVRQLGLAPPGKQNALWMLNYPFPYQNSRVNGAYATMANRLADALQAIGKPEFKSDAAAFFSAQDAFRQLLRPKDYRYFSFQCWQEGTARYTEIAIARLASQTHASDPSFLTDAQSTALAQDAQETYERVTKLLHTPLSSVGRSSFYALGAGEALVLEQVSPSWRAHYLNAHMDLDALR